jgi:uncharacterized protein
MVKARFTGAAAVLGLVAGCATNGAPLAPDMLVNDPYGRIDLTANTPSPLETVRVTFESQRARLAGVLYYRGHKGRRTMAPPVVIVTGSWSTVKEQMPSTYAPLLAEAGFASLIFDFRGYGESDGQPRDVESVAMKAEDIRAAVRFLQGNGGVDARRIGILPICASAGVAVLAAKDEPGIKSIAMVAPWLHNKEIVRNLYGGELGVAQRLEQARVARQIYGEAGIVSYIKVASNSDPTAALYMNGDLDYYLNPKRGAVRQWGARFAVMAWTEWLQFDPIALADKVNVPTRIITGDLTATPDGARAFAARMKAPHDVVSLPGSQFDFYDHPRTVSSAAAAAIEHFRRTL